MRSSRPMPLCVAMAPIFGALLAAGVVRAAEDQKPTQPVEIAGGELAIAAPGAWKVVEPRSRIVEFEFSVPAEEGDEREGRVTGMRAGGGVEANVDRWLAQFTQPDGSPTKDRAKTDEQKIGGHDVYLVDVSGTYMDRPAPALPGVERENYRMLGAIIDGTYFIKFYGPAKTVDANAEGFQKMLESLRDE